MENEFFEDGMKYKFYGVDHNCFKIGKRVYEAVEDESDGYRSYLGSVEVVDSKSKKLIFFRTAVDEVTVQKVDTGYFDGYHFVAEDGHIWLRVGTDNADDYYPMFTFDYQPRLKQLKYGNNSTLLPNAFVAQRQMQRTFNPLIVGSSPTEGTRSQKCKLVQTKTVVKVWLIQWN